MAQNDSIIKVLGSAGRFLTWLDEGDITEANAARTSLFNALDGHIKLSFADTKPHLGDLSAGCQHCGDGTWSCLFVNQTCNATCFYCPMEPTTRHDPPPTSLGVDFPDADRYVDFIERAGYGGVGLSGGEPLLNMDRTVAFVETIRRRLGDSIYIWLYTNGILANEKRLARLHDVGVNEVRFDISAINYSLKPVKRARKLPWKITVEIPAIPEDEDRVARLLPDLRDCGVDYLHLHQLTVNQWNAGKFVEHEYTLLHDPANAVLESEFTALRLLQRANEMQIGLNVQYCARAYKIRFQGRGRRLRLLQLGWGKEHPRMVVDGHGFVVANEPISLDELSDEVLESPPLVPSPQAGCLVGKTKHVLPERAVRSLEPVLVRKLGLPDEQAVPLRGWDRFAIRLVPAIRPPADHSLPGLPRLR